VLPAFWAGRGARCLNSQAGPAIRHGVLMGLIVGRCGAEIVVCRKGRSIDLDIAAHIGLAVRKHRTALRLTQEELAGRADFDRTYIGQIEQGRRNPTMLSLERVAHALGLELDVLIATARDLAAGDADAV